MPQLIGHSLALTRIGGLADPSNTLHYDFLLNSSTAITGATKRGPNLTFTRTGNAMSFDSSGNLVYAPHQICRNTILGELSGEPLPAGWSDGFVANGTGKTFEDKGDYFEMTIVCTNNRPAILASVTVLDATVYTIGCHIVSIDYTSGNPGVMAAVNTSGTDASISDSDFTTEGWYAAGILMGDASVNINLGLGTGGPSVGTVVQSRPFIVKGLLPGVSVGSATKLSGPPLGRWIGTTNSNFPFYDQPRFAHDPADSNAQFGLLMEEARTNKCLQSEDLETTWTNPGANTTITANAAVAPDGNTTAEDVKHGDSAETIQQTITITDNTVVAISAYVKQGTTGSHDFVKMEWMDNSDSDNGFEAWFDLSTGNVGTAQVSGTGSYTANSATMTDVGNSWFRISAVGQIVTGQTDGRIEIINTTADAVDTAEATNSVFWWGLQVEEGTFPTSYIPTTTASVTRATDVPPTTTDVSGVNASNLSIFAQAIIPTVSAQERSLFTVDDGGTTDVIRLYMDAAENINFETVNSGDTNGASDGAATIAVNTVFKTMGTAEDDSVIGYVDGTASTEDTSAGIPVTDAATTIRIGGNSGSTVLNGYMQTAKMWNVTKPVAFSEAETT